MVLLIGQILEADDMNRIHLLAAAILSVLMLPTVAHAESIFKRIKCADYFQGQGLILLTNRSPGLVGFGVRVTRDGCRPKGDAGDFVITWHDGNARNSQFVRHGKYTQRITGQISANSSLVLHFETLGGASAGGTFDLEVAEH